MDPRQSPLMATYLGRSASTGTTSRRLSEKCLLMDQVVLIELIVAFVLIALSFWLGNRLKR